MHRTRWACSQGPAEVNSSVISAWVSLGAPIALHHVTPGTDGCQPPSIQRNYGYSFPKHAVCFTLLNSRGGDGTVLFQLDSPS